MMLGLGLKNRFFSPEVRSLLIVAVVWHVIFVDG